MIIAIIVLVNISIYILGILVFEIYYRVTRNIYPFCRREKKHEK